MVSKMYYYKRDPNGQGRGAGYYYHRGRGNFSKYSAARDMAQRHSLVGHKDMSWEWQHTVDRKKTSAGYI